MGGCVDVWDGLSLDCYLHTIFSLLIKNLSLIRCLPTSTHTHPLQVWTELADGSCRWRQTGSEIKIMVLKVPQEMLAKQLVVTIEPLYLKGGLGSHSAAQRSADHAAQMHWLAAHGAAAGQCGVVWLGHASWLRWLPFGWRGGERARLPFTFCGAKPSTPCTHTPGCCSGQPADG